MNEVKHGPDYRLEAAAKAMLAPKAPDAAAVDAAIDAALLMQEEWKKVTRKSFEQFAAAGRLLSQQKLAMDHGEWLPWLYLHLPAKYGSAKSKEAVTAWTRTAQNWMRIAEILDHCAPAMLETAQTVGQLFRLAQFLPEGMPGAGSTPDSSELITRFRRRLASLVPLFPPDRIRALPAETRRDLRDQLAPLWEAVTA